MTEMTINEKIHFLRGVITLSRAVDHNAQDSYEIAEAFGEIEGFEVAKVGIVGEDVHCVFCDEAIPEDDGDILMAIADPENAEEIEFAEGTGVIMFAGCAHGLCREESEADARWTCFTRGRKQWMKECSEGLEDIKKIVDRVVEQEKKKAGMN